MQIINYIILGASFVTAVTTICTFLKRVVEKTVNKAFEPIYQKIDELDKSQCKNFLVTYLSDVEEGKPQDPIVTERAYEIKEHYTEVLHGNSYIGDKWNKLMK